ncbi:hypothetical protein LguiB_026947 [Lonicera macranthoides]
MLALIQCFKQNSPIFDPKYSSTYKNVPYISRPCAAATCGPNNYCRYNLSYDDKSTRGDLAVDSFTFGSTSDHPITIPNVVFGCGHKNGVGMSVNVDPESMIMLTPSSSLIASESLDAFVAFVLPNYPLISRLVVKIFRPNPLKRFQICVCVCEKENE